jgi:hypothetical protein
MSKSKGHRVSIGPGAVAIYPVSAFTRVPNEALKDIWQVIGSTVEKNINRPLWMQYCAIYWEGLNHGSAAAQEREHG